ncbi:uncharacterized protein BXZ73DRAFT_76217 [Epithele typhae]|uniref:uncharacterized protein n=1 Tax=Epithele typhae TaxID=378194 RepID=UPI002008335A|nr:uncharacterized protein BXZ73DRAFT_76217 [Epithele typhae]KAH9939079.1 hypothetical protein BXZ73DRAFT_76217 [Epithele typhae]
MAAAVAYTLPFPNFSDVVLPSDRAQLAGLSHTAVQAWTASRAEEYRRLALGLLSVYNAVTPINRLLPTEILSEVFAHCWKNKDSRSIRVTHVCRLWRAILHTTTRFWAAAASAPGAMFDFELYHYMVRDNAEVEVEGAMRSAVTWWRTRRATRAEVGDAKEDKAEEVGDMERQEEVEGPGGEGDAGDVDAGNVEVEDVKAEEGDAEVGGSKETAGAGEEEGGMSGRRKAARAEGSTKEGRMEGHVKSAEAEAGDMSGRCDGGGGRGRSRARGKSGRHGRRAARGWRRVTRRSAGLRSAVPARTVTRAEERGAEEGAAEGAGDEGSAEEEGGTKEAAGVGGGGRGGARRATQRRATQRWVVQEGGGEDSPKQGPRHVAATPISSSPY